MHILLVDDEIEVTDNLALYLKSIGHTVESVHWVADLAALIENLDHSQPDAVILDFEMSREGDEVYHWIKNWKPSTKIVFYTPYGASPMHRLRMRAAGAKEDEIIDKREVATDVREILKALA